MSPVRRAPLFTLFAATTVSLTGTAVSLVAVPWYVLVTTGSAVATGLVSAVMVLSEVLGGLFGGAVVDRVGPRWGSVLTDLGSGVAVAGIPALHATVGVAYWQVVALVAVRALFDSPGLSARVSLIPSLARAAEFDLVQANSIWHSCFRGATLVGAPLAGLLIASAGPADLLWLNAAGFWCSALLVAAGVPATVAGRPEASGGTYFTDVLDGIRALFADPVVMSLALTVAVVNFLNAPLNGVLFPVYARQGHGGSAGLGVLLAATAAGQVVGLLLFGALARRLPRRPAYIVSLLASGLLFLGLAAAPNLPVAVVLLVAASLLFGPINPISITVIHERVPARLHGRIIGATRSVAFAAAPLGALIGGAATQVAGLETALLVFGAVGVATAASAWFNPAFRRLEREPAPVEVTAPATGK